MGIQFAVVNNGGTATGAWKLTAQLPTTPAQTLKSATQQSLRSGDTMLFTLAIDEIGYSASNDVIITIDSDKNVNESNENNNVLRVTVKQNSTNTNDPDLSVKILDTGVMTGGVSTYQAKSSVSDAENAAIRFEVENKSSKSTGSWSFDLEYPEDQEFNSGNQTSLAPGEKRIYTVRINLPEDEENDVKVIVDPNDNIDEENESNNSDSTEIETN
jgi:subtilase family serine protease